MLLLGVSHSLDLCDFTASPLILQHFCHFTKPPPQPSTSPLNTSSPPSSCRFFFHFHQPSFRHYLSVNTSQCLNPKCKWFLPQGVGLVPLHRPLQICYAPRASHLSFPLSPPPFSAMDERRQLEETERNGPNYSIGN